MRVGHRQASIKNPSRSSYWGFFMPEGKSSRPELGVHVFLELGWCLCIISLHFAGIKLSRPYVQCDSLDISAVRLVTAT